MHFGATLHLLRSHSGLSLRGLASRVGVSAAYLSRVEHGHDPPPSPARARAIAQAIGVSGDTLVGLLDEVRLDGAEWLCATATGRRLAAELRRRRLTEAQLARVLAFVVGEFPAEDIAPGEEPTLRELLGPGRVLRGVRVGRVEDGLTLAALRLSEGEATGRLLGQLSGGEAGATSAIGEATLVSFARGLAPRPTAALVVLDSPLAYLTPDDKPLRLLWVLAGVGEGRAGAATLLRVARLADEQVVAGVLAADSAEEVLRWLERFEPTGAPGPGGAPRPGR